MRVYLKKRDGSVYAEGDYNFSTGYLMVKKGSIISENINYSKSFRGAKSIEKKRKGILNNNELTENVTFKSASTAANFVTGGSTNGMIAWKNKDGKTLRQIKIEKQ